MFVCEMVFLANSRGEDDEASTKKQRKKERAREKEKNRKANKIQGARINFASNKINCSKTHGVSVTPTFTFTFSLSFSFCVISYMKSFLL